MFLTVRSDSQLHELRELRAAMHSQWKLAMLGVRRFGSGELRESSDQSVDLQLGRWLLELKLHAN